MRTLLTWIALALPLAAAPSEPGPAAVAFLEHLRAAGKADLAPGTDTAISENTQESKRAVIARSLERTAAQLKIGTLVAVADKSDGDLAAVIVRQSNGLDPGMLHVYPIALLRKNATWRPAPVIGSFENTGMGLDPAARKRASVLENWMLDEQSRQLEAARTEINNRLKQDITSAVSPDQLRGMTAQQAAASFVKACASRNIPLALALLGGLQPQLPDDWPVRLKAANAAIADPARANRQWRLLVAPEVLRTIIREDFEDDGGSFILACVDPAKSSKTEPPPIETVRFEIAKSDDSPWQITPPAAFLAQPNAKTRAKSDENDEDDDGVDSDDEVDDDLLDALPSRLRKDYPARNFSDFAAARDHLTNSLITPTPAPLIEALDLTGPPAIAISGVRKVAALWFSLHDPAHAGAAFMLDSHSAGDQGAASFQFLFPGDMSLNLRPCYFERDSAGWHLLAGFAPNPTCDTRFAKVIEWAALEKNRWETDWLTKVLESCPVALPSAATPPPPDSAIRTMLASWQKALRAKDLAAALKLTTRLDAKKSPSRLLRNLGYDTTFAPLAENLTPAIRLARGNIWAAAACPTGRADADTPVYPIIATPAGPRILLEADLLVAVANRSRDYLNRQTFSHLRDTLPENTVAELQSLFDQFAVGKKP